MKFADGRSINLHQLVWFNEGLAVGVVVKLIESTHTDELEQFGLDEGGIFLCFDVMRHSNTLDIFTPERSLEEEGVEPLDSAEKAALFGLISKLQESHMELRCLNGCGAFRIADSKVTGRDEVTWILAPIGLSSGMAYAYIPEHDIFRHVYW